MKWWRYLLPWLRRERIAEDKQANEQFKAQVREALLRGNALKEAAAQLKETREKYSDSFSIRRPMSSRPDPI